MSELDRLPAQGRKNQVPTTAILPPTVGGRSVRDLVQDALRTATLETERLNKKVTPTPAPNQGPKKTMILQTGHLEALKATGGLSSNARAFLNAFVAIDNYLSENDFQNRFTGSVGTVLKELEPHFQEFGVKCQHDHMGWAIVRNLSQK